MVSHANGSPNINPGIGRLQFLDHTLRSLISRFESEFPECRTAQTLPTIPPLSALTFPYAGVTPASPRPQSASGVPESGIEPGPELVEPNVEEDVSDLLRGESPSRSRTNSDASTNAASSETSGPSTYIAHSRPKSIDVTELATLANSENIGFPPLSSRRTSTASIAARAQTMEEGQMHKFGQKMRRDVLPPSGTDDHLHRTSSKDPAEPEHLQALRRHLEQLGGDEIRESVLDIGLDATVQRLGAESERMRRGSNSG